MRRRRPQSTSCGEHAHRTGCRAELSRTPSQVPITGEATQAARHDKRPILAWSGLPARTPEVAFGEPAPTQGSKKRGKRVEWNPHFLERAGLASYRLILGSSSGRFFRPARRVKHNLCFCPVRVQQCWLSVINDFSTDIRAALSQETYFEVLHSGENIAWTADLRSATCND